MVKIHLLPVVQVGEQRHAAHDRHHQKSRLDKRIFPAQRGGNRIHCLLPVLLHPGLRQVSQPLGTIFQRALRSHQRRQQQAEEETYA